MSRFASLTSRLVATTVLLAVVVSALLGTATTLAVRSYLTAQLHDDVERSLNRAENLPFFGVVPSSSTAPSSSPNNSPGGGPGGPGPGDAVGNLIAQHDEDYSPSWIGWVVTQDDDGQIDNDALSSKALDQLAALPSDGRTHRVEIDGFGDYLVAVSTDGDHVAGQPTADIDAAVANLVRWEIALALVAIMGAGGAATIVVRRQLRPLREVASTAHAVADLPLDEGEIDLRDRVPAHLTDENTEVGQVGAALNTLLDHVGNSLSARHRSELQVRQFVADASHELRTPLATITGYAELARRRPGDAAMSATALAKVEEEAGRMTALVEDLLLLARLDSGRPLEQQPVDLTRLLIEAVSDARVLAPDHRWRVETGEDPVEVTGDEQRLHQVITNLLTNARKYTPSGSTITVSVEPGGFRVHDDGPGFPSDLVAHAFERFARGDAARNREGGVGLGLALVEAIVHSHGGTVSLASRPGDTTITVRLP